MYNINNQTSNIARLHNISIVLPSWYPLILSMSFPYCRLHIFDIWHISSSGSGDIWWHTNTCSDQTKFLHYYFLFHLQKYKHKTPIHTYIHLKNWRKLMETLKWSVFGFLKTIVNDLLRFLSNSYYETCICLS